MNEMELQTTLDPIEMDMGDPEIVYSPVLPNPEGEPTDDLTKVQIQGNIYKVKDSEVHEWARAENKPTYTKAEVGLGNVDNTSDLDKPISTATQTALDGKVDNSELGNYYTKSEVNSALDNKADKSDTYTKTETDNLLSEKADSSSVYTKTETDTALDNKVDKVSGKGLSTNDYDDTAKGIVDGVTSSLDNKVDKDGDKVLSDNNYSDTDKTKLDGIEAEANKTVVDNSVTATSTNPVESKAIYNLLNDLLPEAEETGNPISITNASGFNAKALTVDMLPIQEGSGTPSPDNIRPISGRTSLDVTVNGKNLFDKNNFKFVKGSYINSQGVWTGNTTILNYPEDTLSDYWNSPLFDVSLFKDKVLTFSNFISSAGVLRGIIDENFNVLATVGNSATANASIDLSQYPTAKYLALSFIKSSYNFDNAQIELGSSATTYEPYKLIDTETINFGETVYGGTCDVVNGETSDKWTFETFDGSSDEVWSLQSINTHNIANFRIVLNTNVKRYQYTSISNRLTVQTSLIADTTTEGYTISNENILYIRIKSSTASTVEQFRTWLSANNIEICGEKVTPTTLTTPATPISLNKGNNTLSTSGDNMDLKYSTTISNPTSLSMGNPLSLSRPNLQTVVEHEVEEPTEETDER